MIWVLPTGSEGQVISNQIVASGFRTVNLGQVAPNEIILKPRPGVSEAQINGVLGNLGIRRIAANILSGNQRVVIPSDNVAETLALLNSNPLVAYAEPNYLARAELIPNDPYYIYQWNFPMINMELAWDLSIGANVVVAVIDTGVAYQNNGIYAKAPDLAGTVFVPGWDFANDDAYPDDDNGHGTHITGTIAQTTNNLVGVAGVAYGCSVMPVKVLDEYSNGLISDIADGIYFAVNNGARIINMSFGTYTASLTLEEAINYAYLNGVSVITSAGNNATSIPHYPSSYTTCVCVTAVRYDKTRPFYANYGPDIDVCAPGGDLSVDQNLDGHQDGICQQTHNGTIFNVFQYALYQGTSCAAAHTSGVGALVLSVAPTALTPDELKSILETTSLDLGAVGWDQDFGWGLINALNAVQSVLPVATVAAASPLIPVSILNPWLNPITITLGQALNSMALLPFNVPFPGLNTNSSLSTVFFNNFNNFNTLNTLNNSVFSENLSGFLGSTLQRSSANTYTGLSDLRLNPLVSHSLWSGNPGYFQQPLYFFFFYPL